MMKILFKVLLGLFLLVGLGGVVALFFVDTIVQRTIEREATAALGVETRVQVVSLHLFNAECALNGLRIANPPDFESEHFLKLDKTAVSVTVLSVLKDTIEIPSFSLDGLDVNLERNKNGKKNYQVILDNSKSPASGSSKKKFIVKQIVIKNVSAHVNLVSLGGPSGKPMDIHLKELVVHDIGTDANGSVEMTSLMQALVQGILTEIVKSGGNLLPSDLTKDLSSMLPKGLGEATKEAGDKAKETLKGVGNLFKKK